MGSEFNCRWEVYVLASKSAWTRTAALDMIRRSGLRWKLAGVRTRMTRLQNAILSTLLAVFLSGNAAGQSAPSTVPSDSDAPAASLSRNDQFRSAMDRVFGPNGWRETSGYRSRARENQLRMEGAGTVPAGRLSHHSLGTPDAPGAYDAVVDGLPQARAAAVLRASGQGFSRVVAERAYGPQGPHLHIEVASALAASSTEATPASHACDSIYLRVAGGRRNPQLTRC